MRQEEDCHDDNGECGHEAGTPAGVQLVEGDGPLCSLSILTHVDLFVDGGLGESLEETLAWFCRPRRGRRCA